MTFRRSMDEFVRHIARRNLLMKDEARTAQKLPEDWGVHYPADYLKHNFDVWVRSGFTVYPNGLAYDDQDPALITDFFMLLSDLDYQTQYLKQDKDAPAAKLPSFEDL